MHLHLFCINTSNCAFTYAGPHESQIYANKAQAE